MLLDLLLENIAAAHHTAAAFDLAVDSAADMAVDMAADLARAFDMARPFEKARAADTARARPFEKARARAASLSIRLLKHQPIYHNGIGQPGAFLFFYSQAGTMKGF